MELAGRGGSHVSAEAARSRRRRSLETEEQTSARLQGNRKRQELRRQKPAEHGDKRRVLDDEERRAAVNKRRREIYAAKKQQHATNIDGEDKEVTPRYYCLQYSFNDAADTAFTVGILDQICHGCKALHFKGEQTRGKKCDTFLECCNHGKVQLTAFREYPPLLRNLLLPTDDDEINDPSAAAAKGAENRRQFAGAKKK